MSNRRGFTLVELLVVIGIIALLVSILLPAIGNARRQAGAVKCQTQLREIGTCFKMYENDHKGYWPVARVNGITAALPYNIDGFNFNTSSQGYWFNFLAKYATKSRMGAEAAATGSALNGLLSRETIFFGCPAFIGYRNGGATTLVGDTNVVQVGYGMNAYPSFAPDRNLVAYPPIKEQALQVPAEGAYGGFRRAKEYQKYGSQRMVIADGKLWLAASGRPPTLTTYPPAVVSQPEFSNSTAGIGDTLGSAPTQTLVDIYRHGKFPAKNSASTYDPRGGKILYNILYADGHVAQAADGREAYYSMRLRFP